jgi:hypothetical protein
MTIRSVGRKTARKRRHVGSRGRLEGNFKIGARSNRIRFAERRDQ